MKKRAKFSGFRLENYISDKNTHQNPTNHFSDLIISQPSGGIFLKIVREATLFKLVDFCPSNIPPPIQADKTHQKGPPNLDFSYIPDQSKKFESTRGGLYFKNMLVWSEFRCAIRQLVYFQYYKYLKTVKNQLKSRHYRNKGNKKYFF